MCVVAAAVVVKTTYVGDEVADVAPGVAVVDVVVVVVVVVERKLGRHSLW